ncbi:MAG: V-type ATP synthase subunit E [Clostridia bacterium]|nr:V-type ATP synthase subunit E [Clostridia bacterium]
MTGLLNILAQIETEATKKADEIILKANNDANEMISAAKKEAQEILESYTQKAEKKIQEILSRTKASNEIEKKRTELFKKQEIIKNVLKTSKSEIKSQGNDDYFAFLESVLNKYAQDKNGTVVLSPKDFENMTESFKSLLSKKGLEAKAGDVTERNGFIIVYGNIEINCTVDAIFDAESEMLSDMLNKFLFDSEGGN